MGTPSDWIDVAVQIRAAKPPWSSPAVIRLFQLAEEDGRTALRSFAAEMGDAAIADLIRDFVTAKLALIVAAYEPRGYFIKAIRRAAISRKRRASSKVEESSEEDAAHTDAIDRAERAHVAVLDLEAAWSRLSPREQAILTAVRAGEDREAIARLWNVQRNTLDQIVSRAMKRLREEDA